MSYLGQRTQYVQIENKTSSSLKCIDLGAPEGTVLAGLIHLIYCNDQPACHEQNNGASTIVFVDDNTGHVQAKDKDSLQRLFQNEVNLASQWLSDNRLCIAPDKSKILITGNQSLKNALNYYGIKIDIGGFEVQESSSEKMLGVVVNNKMTFRNHIHGDGENEG